MLRQNEKPWKPLSPDEIVAVFRAAAFPWWIAGGHAIEHFAGRQLRSHADIDILVLHKHHSTLRIYLSDWDCWVADPIGQLRFWRIGEALGEHVHNVWCRQDPGSAWSFQVILDQSDGTHWQSRRCLRVRKLLSELGVRDEKGAPYLTPGVQLFYKAKSPRAKDALDFDASLPLLTDEQRAWLASAIEAAYGPANMWLKRLRML